MANRPWSEQDDQELRRRRAAGESCDAIAAALDRTAIAVKSRLRSLGCGKRKPPRWTAEDKDRLGELLDAHVSYARIARMLSRSTAAVIIQTKRHLHRCLSKSNGRTLKGTARVMGVEIDAVCWWIREGWLQAHRTGLRRSRGEIRVVEHDDLTAFLSDPDHWQVWQPERIRDWALREWATEMRAGVRFLTVGEVARQLYVTVGTVSQWIRDGKIRAARRGPNWVIRESDVAYPRPASRNGYQKLPPLDADQTEFVRRWWGKRPTTWIADQLSRGDGAVYGAAERLGLPKLGAGYWNRQGMSSDVAV